LELEATWNALTAEIREIGLLAGAHGLLGWDQQTYMPKGAGELRGQQKSVLSRLCHERMVSEQMGAWLEALSAADLDPTRATAVRRLRRDYEREVRVPADLVQRLSVAGARGFAAWLEAREASDFRIFQPHLEELLSLKMEKAEAIDADRPALQVLMDPYDPGVSLDALATTFSRLQSGLSQMIDGVRGQPTRALGGTWPVDAQRAMHRTIARSLGYDFSTGRIDAAEHPFSISLGHTDVRITTHLYENDLLDGLGSTVHEVGHALYEQGLPADLAGTGLDQAGSYGLHESQSRFWENTVGRSLAFFEWLAPHLEQHFPGHGRTPDDLYRAANAIEPGLIRVRADEVTYNLHIIVRVQLELALFDGSLAVADLPTAWNDAYRDTLGLVPGSDKEGVLQDVHWSDGAFAYFQSYTLGNLYAAAFGATMREDLPALDDRIRAGDFAPILGWLREKVHRHGCTLDGAERVRAVVGDRDYVDDLLSYLWSRHGALYGLTHQ
jgi:carboxypeptidase Taq